MQGLLRWVDGGGRALKEGPEGHACSWQKRDHAAPSGRNHCEHPPEVLLWGMSQPGWPPIHPLPAQGGTARVAGALRPRVRKQLGHQQL